MDKLEDYIEKYKRIHDGTDKYMSPGGQLHTNEPDPTKGKTLFDGSQLGKKFPFYIQEVIDSKRRAITLLDYGCGKAIHTYMPLPAHGNKTLLGRFNGMIQCYYCYDPAVDQYSIPPPGGMVFDLTCCADVMEHVPEEFVPKVLREIGTYTKDTGAMLFSISGNPAKKSFHDGENLHITVKPLDWWTAVIRRNCGDKAFVLIYNNEVNHTTSVRFYNSHWFEWQATEWLREPWYEPATVSVEGLK